MGMNPRLLRPTASGFDPRRIADLFFWLDAADYNASTGVWTDRSGNGRTFANTTHNNRPTKTATLNGLPVVTFDGSNDILTDRLIGPTFSSTAWSAFAVMRPQTTTGARGILTADAGSNPRGPQIIRQNAGSNFQAIGFPSATPVTVSSTPAPSVGVARLLASIQSATTLSVFVDGNSPASSACVQQAFSNTFGVSIGVAVSNAGFADNYLNGDIGELIMYTRAVSTAERQRVQQYLARKWGITL